MIKQLKGESMKKVTIGINVPPDMANELERRALNMHFSKSGYCAAILQQWLNEGEVLILTDKGSS
jgi:hypothetical protein